VQEAGTGETARDLTKSAIEEKQSSNGESAGPGTPLCDVVFARRRCPHHILLKKKKTKTTKKKMGRLLESPYKTGKAKR